MACYAVVLILVAKTWVSIPEEAGYNLQAIIDSAKSGDTLILKNGTYEAIPNIYKEDICGNCVEAKTDVNATVGFYVKGKSLVIIGEERDSVRIVTNAGYGVLFEDSYDSYIGDLTVTGGKRDPDGNATDAAIVVKNSRVTIKNTLISSNVHRIDTVVVGIGGIFGREGGELHVCNNIIKNNGWDGIALYRGAIAVIADNVIQEGRGAGIGITWDASALVYRNSISGYWKGIGAFGRSVVVVKNNLVFDNLGWGVIATGQAYMEVVNNVIFHNGNCGFAVWEQTATGILKNNIIAGNGWKKEWVCPGVGIWMNTTLENFPILFNNIWNNKKGNYKGVDDQTDLNGNKSCDPLFENKEGFELKNGSPCIDTGDPEIIDSNGSVSDMGLYGGPLGRWNSK
jgi:hypothetical protein